LRGTRNLDRVYDRLEPWERFQLALAAQARDDDRDAERLARTCPRRSYQGGEPEFLEPLELACELAHAFAAEILPLAGRLDVAEAAAELAAVHFQILADSVEFIDVHAHASKGFRREVCDAIKETSERYVAFLARIRETLTATGATAAHAFAAFCEHELGVEPETLLGAFARITLPAYERFAANPADPEEVANYHAALAGAWRCRLGRKADPTAIPRPT